MQLNELNATLTEGKIKDAEDALARHAKYKIDYEQTYGPMSPADIVSHEIIRKRLLDNKKRAQRAYGESPRPEGRGFQSMHLCI